MSITEILSGMSRDDLSGLLESLGAKVSNSVSKNTYAVIAGSETGSKLDKAISLGVRVVTDSELDDFLKSG